MMFHLPQETLEVHKLVQQLTEEYQMPLQERMLNGETLSKADFLPGRVAARKMGLWGFDIPESYGGTEITPLNRTAVYFEASKCIAPLAIGGIILPGLFASNDRVKDLYLERALNDDLEMAFAQTEPTGGADPSQAIRTRADKKDGRWVINGTKIYITNAAYADVFFVVCITDPEKGVRGGISILCVDRDNPGLTISPVKKVIGNRETHELYFDNCEIAEEMVIGQLGSGFVGAQQFLSAMRLDVGAKGLGVATRAYEMMRDYSKERVVFGSPLSEKQAIQSLIVDSYMEIEQAKLYMWQSCAKSEAGQDIRVEAGMVKTIGTELSSVVVDRAIQVHGGAGVTVDSPLAYWYANQRAPRIFEGPSEVHKYQVMARHLLK